MSDPRKLGDSTPSRFFVFMGVCGAGKSTVARGRRRGDGGRLSSNPTRCIRPPTSKAMAEGQPLTDAQRWPWLEAVCEAARASDADRPVTIACSALARRYRDFIRARLPGAIFIHLRRLARCHPRPHDARARRISCRRPCSRASSPRSNRRRTNPTATASTSMARRTRSSRRPSRSAGGTRRRAARAPPARRSKARPQRKDHQRRKDHA